MRQGRAGQRAVAFVIDAAGALAKAWRGVKVAGHVDEVLAFVKSLA